MGAQDSGPRARMHLTQRGIAVVDLRGNRGSDAEVIGRRPLGGPYGKLGLC